MIQIGDQEQLLSLIGARVQDDTECYAFGGTAMMFQGFKDETKDIDLLFEDSKSHARFVSAIKGLGFNLFSPRGIYIPEKLREKDKPLMYVRDEARLDIFLKRIFRSQISPKMKNDVSSVHDYGKLRIKVLQIEQIVFLKSITDRDKDIEDILAIIQKHDINWQYLVDEAIWQHRHGDIWALLDLEKAMHELKKETFIEQKYFNQLYKAQKKG